MKFPLTTRIVPALELSDQQRAHYGSLARTLVDDTILQYESYALIDQHRVDKEMWKTVKKRELLTVYKERNAALDEVRPWSMPTLLMVGSIVGTLDDVMYGAATFSGPAMLLKTTYTRDELADGEILNEIRGPTARDPFRYLGIKWVVKGNPTAVNKLVRPRDLVFLEATGIREGRPGAERIGYHLMHSLELPGYGPLQGKTKEILRGRVSSCIVFKQLANSTVDVYMRAHFEPNGKAAEQVAMLSAANGLIYCWRSVFCAQHKKLAWLLAKTSTRNKVPLRRTTDPEGLSTDCSTCSKSARAYRQMTACALCSELMCSTCRISKTISFVDDARTKQIVQRKIPFCKRCITSASQLSAFEVARDEVVSGMWAPGGAGSATPPRRTPSFFRSAELSRDATSSSEAESSSSEMGALNIGDYAKRTAATPEATGVSRPAPQSSSAALLAFEKREFERFSHRLRVQQQKKEQWPRGSQEEMYERIAQLRNRAESAYQITMNTTAMHINNSPAQMGSRDTRRRQSVEQTTAHWI